MDDDIRSVVEVARRHIDVDMLAALDDPDAELSALGLDSLRMVSFILDIEGSFAIEFPSEMIDVGTFHSLRAVATAVRVVREQSMM